MNLSGTVRLNRRGWLVAGAALLLLGLLYHRSRGGAPARVSGARLVALGARAARAGGLALQAAGDGGLRSKGLTKEGAEQPVTDADLASHCAMWALLAPALPAAHLVSEETVAPGACPKSPPDLSTLIDDPLIAKLPDELYDEDDITIWIDPLDATQEFTEKLHNYVTTMVCVAVKGVPIIGVIHKPFSKETTWAWVSKGVSNDIKDVKSDDGKQTSVIIVSRSHKGKVESFASNAFGSHYEVIPAGGAGYKVLEVVHSRADVYIHTTLIKKWDICAGNAILDALGGRMSTLKNETIDYSHDSDSANNGGLLASLTNHNLYVEKSRQIKS